MILLSEFVWEWRCPCLDRWERTHVCYCGAGNMCSAHDPWTAVKLPQTHNENTRVETRMSAYEQEYHRDGHMMGHVSQHLQKPYAFFLSVRYLCKNISVRYLCKKVVSIYLLFIHLFGVSVSDLNSSVSPWTTWLTAYSVRRTLPSQSLECRIFWSGTELLFGMLLV